MYKVRIGRVSAASKGDEKAGFVHTVRKGATLELKQISSSVIFVTNDSTEIAAGVVADVKAARKMIAASFDVDKFTPRKDVAGIFEAKRAYFAELCS